MSDAASTAPDRLPEEKRRTPGDRLRAFAARHHVVLDIGFFFLGFAWDVYWLHRIDSTPLLIHQGAYLVLTVALMALDFHLVARGEEPDGLWGKLASYRLWVMHFFLGTMLNAFMVFYFRAASDLWAFVFLVGLAVLMVVNELPRFRSRGPVVRAVMLSFAITSYAAYLVPVLWGSLRSWHYLVAVVLGTVASVLIWRAFRRLARDPGWTFRRAVLPGLVLHAVLVVLFFAGAIPPVPLSLKHIGIYTDVVPHTEGARRWYTLTFQPNAWWEPMWPQSRAFVARSGDRAWAFIRLFAPARFEDTVQFAWEHLDPGRGWVARGEPHRTRLGGGNEEGWRTFAYTTLGPPGRYRVRVLTADGREIGRAGFTFVEGPAPPTVTVTDG